MQKKQSFKILLRLLKITSVITLIVILIVFSLMITVKFFYQKEIKVIALNHINQQLNSPIDFKDVSVGFISNFPLVSISLSEINIKDPINSKDTLFYCKKLDLNFNAVDLINKNYKVRKLKVNSGILSTKVNKSGVKNYLVIKDSMKDKNSNFRFILDQVSLSNFRIKYKNDILSQNYSFSCNNAILNGDFTDDFYDLEMQSDLKVNYFTIDKLNYIKNKKAKLSFVINVINEPFALKIKKGFFQIAEMNFNVSGDYLSSSNDEINLSINGENIQLSEVFSVFPVDYFSILDRYSSEGKLNFNSSLEGSVSQTNRLLFKANFNAENASFLDLENQIKMSKINLVGNFNNSDQVLKISDFSAFFEDKEFKGSFLIKDFNNPLLNFMIKGALDVNKASFFFKENLVDINGTAYFDLVSELKWLNSSPYFKFIKGNVNASEITFNYLPTKFTSKIKELNINFPNQDLIFDASNVRVNNDQFEARLKVKNWLEILVGKNQKIETDFRLDFQKLNLNQWLTYLPIVNDTSNRPIVKEFNGDIFIENLTFNKIKMENVKLQQISINENIEIESVSMNGQGGDYNLNLSFSELSNKEFKLGLNGKAKLINTNKFFEEFENFDQNWITNDQLFGFMSSTFNAKLFFNQKGQINHNKSKVSSNNEFKNLELIEFSFFDNLLNYFKGNTITKKIIDINYYENHLKRVVFEDFESKVTIYNSLVEIQKTQVNNNILDMNFFGVYSMNDSVDYHLNFNWRDLKKKNKSKKEFDVDDDFGKKLYLRIYGFLDDLNYGLDKKEIKNKRKEKLIEEKQVLKKIISGEITDSLSDSQPPIFEVEFEEDFEKNKKKDSTNSSLFLKNNPKKKKDSSRLSKFLKKIGVEEEDKKKTQFEIDQ